MPDTRGPKMDRFSRSRTSHPTSSGSLDGDAMAGKNTHAVVEGLLDPPRSGGVILDLGAGQGAFTGRLHNLGYQVLALGVSPRQYLASSPYIICDLDAGIPVGSGMVQGVIAIEVVEHLENAYQLIRDSARCLVPGGWIILSTPNTLSLASRISFLIRGYPIYFGAHEYDTNGHISAVSLLDIERIADRCGLSVESVTYNIGKMPIPRLRHRFPLTAQGFRNPWFGESLIVKLRKVAAPRRDYARG